MRLHSDVNIRQAYNVETLAFFLTFGCFFVFLFTRGIMVTNRLRLQLSSISRTVERETMEDKKRGKLSYALLHPR